MMGDRLGGFALLNYRRRATTTTQSILMLDLGGRKVDAPFWWVPGGRRRPQIRPILSLDWVRQYPGAGSADTGLKPDA